MNNPETLELEIVQCIPILRLSQHHSISIQRNELDHLLDEDTPKEPKNKSVRLFGLLLLIAFSLP